MIDIYNIFNNTQFGGKGGDGDDGLFGKFPMPDPFCMPWKIYAVILLICAVIYYGYNISTGKGFPKMSIFSLQSCSMSLLCVALSVVCIRSEILAWIIMLLLVSCTCGCTYSYVSKGGKFF